MLASFSLPAEETANLGWDIMALPFLGLKNGGLQFMWILYLYFYLTLLKVGKSASFILKQGRSTQVIDFIQ